MIISGFSVLMGMQHLLAQTTSEIGQFPIGSLVSDMGLFPEHRYQLTDASNVHHFAGVFNGLPQFNFGATEQDAGKLPEPMLPRLMAEAIVFNRVGQMLVNTENGTIRPGDALTVSSRPGQATKAKATDRAVVGIAVEPLSDESGIINVRVLYQSKD